MKKVLVFHDMLGLAFPDRKPPRFCKMYARVGEALVEGLGNFVAEVSNGSFPSPEYSPYSMAKGEEDRFFCLLRNQRDSTKRSNGTSQVPDHRVPEQGFPGGLVLSSETSTFEMMHQEGECECEDAVTRIY